VLRAPLLTQLQFFCCRKIANAVRSELSQIVVAHVHRIIFYAATWRWLDPRFCIKNLPSGRQGKAAQEGNYE